MRHQQNLEIKHCIHCKTILTEENWTNVLKEASAYICSSCRKQNSLKYYYKDPKRKKKNKITYHKNKEEAINYYGHKCSICDEKDVNKLLIDHINNDGYHHNKIPKHINEYICNNKNIRDEYQVLCYNCQSVKTTLYKDKDVIKAKKKVLNHYGNFCADCGENRIECLTIDHKLKDNKNQYLSSIKLYRYLINNNFPDEDLRILCYNCNCYKLTYKSKYKLINRKIKRTCRECNEVLTINNCTPAFIKRGFNICRKCDNEQTRNQMYNNRKIILTNLGGKCECCNISNLNILSIDHIHGKGIEDRHSYNGWGKYLKTLAKMSIDDLKSKYRCLCYNCNYTKGFWHKCPHTFSDNIDTSTLPISDRSISNLHLPEKEYKERILILRRIIKLKCKLETIKAYGGQCINCNESNSLFLILDHINNNGYKESKSKGVNFYEKLRRLGYPGKNTQLQLLCHNCNAEKEYIHNRQLKQEQIKKEPEIYIAQPYSISKEEDDELWQRARYLYAQTRS